MGVELEPSPRGDSGGTQGGAPGTFLGASAPPETPLRGWSFRHRDLMLLPVVKRLPWAGAARRESARLGQEIPGPVTTTRLAGDGLGQVRPGAPPLFRGAPAL